jgi:oligosaccharyl transferase (archaeosortase A-associated)
VSKLSPRLICGILLALFFGVSLCLRVCLPYDKVFTPEWIKFTSVDAYYHMRLVDNLVHNFPNLLTFDPYLIYPGGGSIGGFHFFEQFLASITWLIGLGAPTQHTVDVVSIFFPAILGALMVIPVYFIGKELFGRWVGVLAAGLIAVLPGEFIGRSLLGFTDGDILSALLTTVAIMFLIMAIKKARKVEWTFSKLRERKWTGSTKIIIYSLLAGLFLGTFILSWQGALLFVFITFIYFVIQFIIDHLKRRSTDYLCFIGFIFFLVTLLVSLPIFPNSLYLASLIITLLIPPVLGAISWFMAGREIRPAYYLLTIVGLGAAGLAIFYAINPSLFNSMRDAFSIFNPAGYSAETTTEMQPLLFPSGDFTTDLAWYNFSTGVFLTKWWPIPGFGLISLCILIYLAVKQGNAERNLLVIWSLVILVAALGQRRFGSYLAVNVALLTAYFLALVYPVIRFIIDYLRGKSTKYMKWQILEFDSLEELVALPGESPTRSERKQAKKQQRKEAKRLQRGQGRTGRKQQEGFRMTVVHSSISLWLIVIICIAFSWNISYAIDTAEPAPFAPKDGWCSSLTWLKENSKEPFGDPDFYYEIYEPPKKGERYENPESAYGVLAWWDYGYWITRIAHRIPNAHPGQNPQALTSVAKYFTSQNVEEVNKIRQRLDSQYVIIDDETATSKFYAMVTWSGRQPIEYLETYYVVQENQAVPVQLYYPEYYRSFSTRLYIFEGKEVTPEKVLVISYQEEMSHEGIPFKLINGVEQFDTYQEAQDYISSQETGNYRIVSESPLQSPVPLKALENYELIHSSNTTSTMSLPGFETIPAVKIFEYVGD